MIYCLHGPTSRDVARELWSQGFAVHIDKTDDFAWLDTGALLSLNTAITCSCTVLHRLTCSIDLSSITQLADPFTPVGERASANNHNRSGRNGWIYEAKGPGMMRMVTDCGHFTWTATDWRWNRHHQLWFTLTGSGEWR